MCVDTFKRNSAIVRAGCAICQIQVHVMQDQKVWSNHSAAYVYYGPKFEAMADRSYGEGQGSVNPDRRRPYGGTFGKKGCRRTYCLVLVGTIAFDRLVVM